MTILRNLMLLFIATSQLAFADSKLLEVSESKQWLGLLHYRLHGLIESRYSEVDDENFFLASNGKYDALDELKATLDAFKIASGGDNAAQCRFPARFAFLKKHFPNKIVQPEACPKYDEWYQQIHGSDLYLIFPSSYINSPSSMYGHTLLRLDGRQGHKLLSSAINFAAYTDPSDDEITYSVKGLMGGYPGYVSLVPYYDKVNTYSHIENRDIWEYKLKLNQDQVNRFIQHIWELDRIRFDYFFIDENCSYRLLTLLDAVEPSWNLSEPFKYRTVPSDTIRALLEKDLVTDIEFRPSKTTLIEHNRQQLPEYLQHLSRSLADDPFTTSNDETYLTLADEDKAKTLELAYDYSRYLALKKKSRDPDLPKRSLKLLSLRAAVPYTGTGFELPSVPTVRDENGHETLRTTFSAGQDFAEIGYRLNYHGWMDVLSGYREGAQIELGNINVRVEDDIRLEHFDVVHVRSLGPRHRFSHPVSWQVRAGYERWINDDIGQTFLKAGGGHAYRLGGGLVYGMANLNVNLSDRYEEDFRIGYGPEVGYLLQTPNNNVLVSSERLASIGAQGVSWQHQAQFGHSISRQQQIRLGWRYQQWQSDAEQEWLVSYVLYH